MPNTLNVEEWENINTPLEIINWIKFGVKIPFNSEPCEYVFPNRIHTNKQRHFVNTEVKKLLTSGAIKEVDKKPHCVSSINCVPKKGGKLRLVIDLRPLNEHINCPYYKNEGIDTVCDLVQTGDHFISIDLKDGFHHIPVHEDSQKYLGFEWNGRYYVWLVLCFGLNISPWFFNKVLRPVVEYVRCTGRRFVIYVDDGLQMSQPQTIEQDKEFLLDLFFKLGLQINFEKSSLVPEQKKLFIGYVVISVSDQNLPLIKIPAQRVLKLKRDINRALTQQSVKARFLAKICGQCISFTKAIVPTKLLLRNLYRLLSTRQSWNDILRLNSACIADLQWWSDSFKSWNGRVIDKRPIDIQITTDASSVGWGATLGTLEAAGSWTSAISHKHSNYRELLTVLMALKSFAKHVKNKVVQILTDNVTTVAYVNKLGGSTSGLSQIATAIWTECFKLNVNLSAKHLAGRLNIHADRLSRINPNSTHEWRLHPAIFKYIDNIWGPHEIDRFANINNAHCVKYNSLYADPNSMGVDALAQNDWDKYNNFVNAPFHLLPKILAKTVHQKASATVIAPVWPAQPWYGTLVKLANGLNLSFPSSVRIRWALGRRPEPVKNRKWKVCAWRICGKSSCND